MERPLQVLLIDPDAGDQARIAQVLREFPALTLDVVADPRRLAEVLAGPGGYDLAISEQFLGWSDGVAVAQAIKSVWPDCPIIIVSKAATAEAAVQVMKAGVADYLAKTPRQFARLPEAVSAALGHARERRELAATEARFRNLFNDMPIGLYQILPDGQIVDANPALRDILGYPTLEALLRANFFTMFIEPEEQERWQGLLAREGVIANFEIKLKRRDGTIIWVDSSARAVYGGGRRVLYYEGSLQNITERKWTEERLSILAHYDALTGLPNRLLFSQRLHQALEDAVKGEFLVAVIFTDLDRFKYINDTLGHETGDLLLKAVAARLSACIREGNTVARLSGDEFGIVLRDVSHIDDVTRAAENILDIFSQPFYVPSRELFISPSLGITVYPFDENDPEGLIKNAEIAMYRAKDRGRNNYQYYSADMTAPVTTHLAMEHALRRALERGELQLYYQPQVNVETGRLVGMEALVRWRAARADVVPPAEFIPLAEETGLIVPIGEWALRTACRQNKAWQDAGLPPLRVAVNLSARQFQQPLLLDTIKNVLADTGLNPDYLELEITESVLMQSTETSIATLNELSRLGIHLSIDDFGTGYSSLSYLKRFPIHAVKIDQSFVRDVTTDADNAAIATAIIAMAHKLGLDVIAEGVETEEQVEFLRSHRSEVMQGYYFGRPMSAKAVGELLRERAAATVH